MTLYAGETVVVWHDAATPEGAPITPDDVTSVTATFYQGSDVLGVVTEMPWVEEHTDSEGTVIPGRWQLLWDTDGLDPGSYRVQVHIYGITGTVDWEFAKIRLNRNPVSA